MKAILLLTSGAILCSATAAGWVWLNALACGMNTTGCSKLTLNWDDWESLSFFVPSFALGLGLMAAGGWRILKR